MQSNDPIESLKKGIPADWRGYKVEASAINQALETSSATRFQILNARIEGDLVAPASQAENVASSLHLIDCGVRGGFIAPDSRWRQLSVARCQIDHLDLSGIIVESDLLLEDVVCTRWLLMPRAKIERLCSLRRSSFSDAEATVAVDLSGSQVGLDLDMSEVRISGELRCPQLRVGGGFHLDGALLDDSGCNPAVALDLAGGVVGGQLRLCQGRERFRAKGRINLMSAELGSLTCKAASIEALGANALIGDQLTIKYTLDLTGLSADGGAPFEAIGRLRFIHAVIGRQLQMADASIEAEGGAVVLDGTNIGGDVIVGGSDGGVRIQGGLSANLVTLGGRLQLEDLEVSGTPVALAIRQGRVAQEVAFSGVRSCGAVQLDSLSAGSLAIQDTEIRRSAPATRNPSRSKNYSDPEDALLELSFAKLSGEFRLDRVLVDAGEVRAIGLSVAAGAQIAGCTFKPEGGSAFLAQSAVFESGLTVGGGGESPACFDGDLQLLGARIGGTLSLQEMRIGGDQKPAKLVLASASLANLTIHKCVINGELCAPGCRVDGDLQVQSCAILNEGQVAVDLRRARIAGKLEWATLASPDAPVCELSGVVRLDGATVGSLGWAGLTIRARTVLEMTNLQIERQMTLGLLEAEDETRLELFGTTTPVLVDRIDASQDSWGAGRAALGLDSFRYDRLVYPSGRTIDSPREVRSWRREWLRRRYDERSSQPARHLAGVLRAQGLHEAARLAQIDAFAAEGRSRATVVGKLVSASFGLFFGYGLSGRRALATLALLWLFGGGLIAGLQDRHLLVAGPDVPGSSRACSANIDPLLMSADMMIPLVDLGQEHACIVGTAPGASVFAGWKIAGGQRSFLGEAEIYRFAIVAFQILGWIILSLAIATWSGLFKRGGRE